MLRNSKLKALMSQTADRARAISMSMLGKAALALPLGLTGLPAFAQSSGGSTLPTVTPPTTGLGGTTVTQGDPFSAGSGYLRLGLQAGIILVCALAVMAVGIGVITSWYRLQDGREALGTFLLHLLIGLLVVGIIVYLGTLGMGYIG
jgi:hypothetical protein